MNSQHDRRFDTSPDFLALADPSKLPCGTKPSSDAALHTTLPDDRGAFPGEGVIRCCTKGWHCRTC
jgi:hypothetical protein